MKDYVMDVFLMKLQGITPPRSFTCEYIRIFNASTGRSYMSSAFLIKLGIVYFRAAAADPDPP